MIRSFILLSSSLESSESTGAIENVIGDAVEATKTETENLTNIMTDISNKFTDILPSLIFAILVLIVGMALSKIVLKICAKALARTSVDLTVQGFLKSLIRIVLYMFVIVITLSVLNVPMSSIVAVIGAAGLAIGLALQNSLSNLAGGFILLFAKPFKVGDLVEIGGTTGTVEGIDILYTRIRTADNKLIHMPNGSTANGTIINYTANDNRRLDLEFGISYEDDFEEAKKIISDIIKESPLALNDPAPTVRVGRHDASSVVIFVWVWVATGDYGALKFDLLEKVKTAFDENGISIPFNQLDVHLEKTNA